jgi:ferredoxin
VKLIISDGCTGHGRCYALAPGIFDEDDEGFGVLRSNGEVATELEGEAQEAVRGCPEQAIQVSEARGT